MRPRFGYADRMLVFIDESGDPGFKLAKGSSGVFVAALVAFNDTEQAAATGKTIEALSAGLRTHNEFKFSKTRPEIKDAFFAAVLPFDFCVRAIVVDKEKIYSPHLRSTKEGFYNFFIKSMLKFDNGLLKGARVVIDGSGDQEFKRELKSMLRRHTGPGAISEVRFSDSRRDRLVQLADMCAGAIARSYREDRPDAGRWRTMLRPKIDDVWDFS